MRNFVEHGEILEITAPSGGVQSGGFVIQGVAFGIAGHSALEGERVRLKVGGVYNLAAATGQAWTQGAPLYWDATAKVATTVSASNLKIGVAWGAKASADAAGLVGLNRSF